ncbi:3-oxo-5-alpha-steroid 4-dehydrogenase [Colletotrichum acutatum]|uniref:Polyprenal reductase n=1 Tax=Glomerella acutata TaxID=27357 RepID=A0AAD8UJG3_GLOAC|nr:3-oxo-5-alpha-steroid 4-dehydrogenase [Colletotrichum acutatum]KAK1722364.1 3-oxo-5-alpha-steroid 4-dehydrogenase [Colletotrichum acutatum]
MDALSALPPAQWCQIFFGLSTAVVLAIQVVPKTTQRLLLDYGARSPANTTDTDDRTEEATGANGLDLFTQAAKAVTSFGQIPHAWFMHFYVASVAGSAFWAWQYIQSGSFMAIISARQAASGGPYVSFEQAVLVWTLMALQGTRRLYECLFVMRPGSSKMWFVHWLLGLGFYLCMSVSVWVDGSGEDCHHPLPDTHSPFPAALRQEARPNLEGLLSPGVVAGTVAYLCGWSNQHKCHKHLASLKKYSLPERGLFRYLICPHYTCECLIYLGLAMIAAPKGHIVNRTLMGALWFIVANLGTTADGTKQWYVQKFGAEKVASKWRMIPFVF